MINRANRIVIVGPHYSGPLANVSDGIGKLAPCTVVAPTHRISYSTVAKSSISARDYEKIRDEIFYRSGELLLLQHDANEAMVDRLRVSAKTKRILREALRISLADHGGYKTGKVRETGVVGIDALPSQALAAGPVNRDYFTLASVIHFAGKFWELFRQGVFEAAKRVDGHTDFGGLVLYLKPPDIEVKTLFFPDGPERTYPIAAEAEALAFGGHDPLTGCKHYEGISGAKAGMLGSDLTVFWSAWNFERFPESRRFGGFFETIQAAGRIKMVGETIIPREDEPQVATFNAQSLDELADYARSMRSKVWDPTCPEEMPLQTARKYVGL